MFSHLAVTSEAPPGGQGQTTRTGWAGPSLAATARHPHGAARQRNAMGGSRYRCMIRPAVMHQRDGELRRPSSVASPIICRSALAIEAHRGVASLANTARYGLRAAYDI